MITKDVAKSLMVVWCINPVIELAYTDSAYAIDVGWRGEVVLYLGDYGALEVDAADLATVAGGKYGHKEFIAWMDLFFAALHMHSLVTIHCEHPYAEGWSAGD